MRANITDPRGRILIVDDEPEALRQLEHLLTEGGHQVTAAYSGAEALERLVEVHPEVVLVNAGMKSLDGFATCRLIRSLTGGRDVPLLLLTSPGDLLLHERAIEAHADDFMPKPVQRSALLMRVRTLVSLRRLRAEVARTPRGAPSVDVAPLCTIYARASRLVADPELMPDQRDTAVEILALCETALGLGAGQLQRPRLPLS